MGKRELLIIAGFAAVGVLAYVVTVRPDGSAPRRFSLSRLLASIRTESRANLAHASLETPGTIALTKDMTSVRVSGVANLEIVGEPRGDVAYLLTVESNGPDDGTAQDLARRTTLQQDMLGSVLSLRVVYPREGRQASKLSLRVPAALAVALQTGAAGARIDVRDVASVDLGNIIGDVRLTDIVGGISGAQRNGDLNVSRAATVDLSLTASRATIADVARGVTLAARNGTCQVERAGGPVTIEQTAADSHVLDAGGLVSISGVNGHTTVERPQLGATIDVQSMEAHVTIDRASPVTVLASNALVVVTIVGEPSIGIDATADDGVIRAPGFPPAADRGDRESHLAATIGTGGARVSIKTNRGDIEIRRTK